MKLVVIDGQSGRTGALLVERIRAAGLPLELLAVGTNAIATAAMMKAGAQRGRHRRKPGSGGLPGCGHHRRAHWQSDGGRPHGGDHPCYGGGRGPEPGPEGTAAGEFQLRQDRGRRRDLTPLPDHG